MYGPLPNAQCEKLSFVHRRCHLKIKLKSVNSNKRSKVPRKTKTSTNFAALSPLKESITLLTQNSEQ